MIKSLMKGAPLWRWKMWKKIISEALVNHSSLAELDHYRPFSSSHLVTSNSSNFLYIYL